MTERYRPPAVIIGGEVTALSIARSLHAAGVRVQVLDVAHSPARYSRAVSGFVDVGNREPQKRMLDWLRSNAMPAVVMAGSDEGVELIARRREELASLGYLPAEGNSGAQLMMLDKAETYALARQHGIAAPRVMPLRTPAELQQAVEQLTFPCVIKPIHSHLFARAVGPESKVEFIASENDLRRRVAELHQRGVEMLVTEVIVGTSEEYVSYFGYLDHNGQSLLTLTKRKLRQQPPGFGIGTYHETTRDPQVAAAGQRFLQVAQMRGLGNVEFKRDASDGELKLIECNPRFTMSNELIQRSGIDLALFCYCRAADLDPPDVSSYRVGMSLWDSVRDIRAFLGYRREKKLSTREWLTSLSYPICLPAFRIGDPLPAVARAGWMVSNVWARSRSAKGRGAPSSRPARGPSAESAELNTQ